MKAKYLQVSMVMMMLSLLLVAGCQKKPRPSADTAIKGPAWAVKGSGAFEDQGSKVFYGVGLASGIQNKALLRQTADNRARAEIAKIMETYVAALGKDYMAATMSSDMKKASEEQHVEVALKTFTKTTVRGAQIIDRWVDPADKIMYSLCKLDLSAFKKALEDEQDMDSKMRDFVRKNAEKLHSEMQKMEK
ncbi:MAG: hypothetical protein H8D61_00060 [Deltaproteobacteria bacterium]|nr:hypothetical protein [Deltaproteobacteria bacterium]